MTIDSRPTAMVCPGCGRLVNHDVSRCPHCGRLAPTLWGKAWVLDRLFSANFSYAQLFLVVNVVVFMALSVVAAVQGGLPGSLLKSLQVLPGSEVLFRFGAAQSNEVFQRNAWWRLITYQFLHAGALHLVMNSFFLRVYGTQVERVYGRARFVLLYLVSGLFGAALTLWIRGPYASTVGASGSVFGLLGILGAYALQRRDAEGRMLFQRVMFVVVLCLVWGMAAPLVDNWCHVGGFVTGFAIGLWFRTREQTRRGEGPGARIAALIALAVCLGSLGTGTWSLFSKGAGQQGARTQLVTVYDMYHNNVQVIPRVVRQWDAMDKAEYRLVFKSQTSKLRKLADQLGDQGDWLRPILEEQLKLDRLLQTGASSDELRRQAAKLDVMMNGARHHLEENS